MDIILQYTKGLEYFWLLVFIMIIAGVAKDEKLFAPVYNWIINTFKNSKVVVVLLSAVGGVLPIEGRVTVSAGLLDTVAPKEGPGRHKFGIIDYISTHHYYMWSPLEKTVIIGMAVLGLSFTEWLAVVWPIILASMVYIFGYMWFCVDEKEVRIEKTDASWLSVVENVLPMVIGVSAYVYGVPFLYSFGLLALYYVLMNRVGWERIKGYVNQDVLFVVILAIILGNIAKAYDAEFQEYLKGMGDTSIIAISIAGFVFSFLMGSSGKFIALAAIMATVFGVEYFIWFFAVDYAGYLLSPTHKCVVIGNRYFGTPFGSYYKVLLGWVALLLITAGVLTFLI